MIEKNWLIRTFDKKILGPVTRDKLLRLLRDNKLSESDEVCPGNHFWVYVKEKKIISELLNAPEIIGFNENIKDNEINIDDSEKDLDLKEKKKP